MASTATLAACPACGGALAKPSHGPAWCTSCEWNLGAYAPVRPVPLGWRWVDRRSHALAYRYDTALYRDFLVERPTRPPWTAATRALLAASVVIVLADLATVVIGFVLLAMWASLLSVVIGVLLVVIGVIARPRFGRKPPRRRRLRRELAPGLFDLVDRVAAACGAQPPDYIVLDLGNNASVERVGLPGRSVLRIGGQLWLALTPQERVAVLAHEFGHLVNGDPTRLRLVAPVLTTFGRFAVITGVNRTLGDIANPYRRLPGRYQLAAELGLWLISRAFLFPHLALTALGARGHQRAEYLADSIAADVAGTSAMVAALDAFVIGGDVARLISNTAVRTPPEQWADTVRSYVASQTDRLPPRRQLTARSADLWSSHPPSGRRAQVLDAQPKRQPRLVLADKDAAAIDAQLPNWIAAVQDRVLGTREFRRSRRP